MSATCCGCGDDFDSDEVEDSADLYEALGVPDGEVYCGDCLGEMFE